MPSLLSAADASLEFIFAASASTGECPTWSQSERALYWVDIEGHALHCHAVRDGSNRRWIVPAEIASFGIIRDGVVLAALRTGIFELDLAAGARRLLAAPPYDDRTHRFNDGKCDAQGRFWVGVMYQPIAGRSATSDNRAKPLCVYDSSHGLRATEIVAEVANGLAWSPDSKTLYFSDSANRTVRRFDFDLSTGHVSNPRVLTAFSARDGTPDGAAIDEEGYYWCALPGGGRIVRLDPAGEVERQIRFPVSRPTMCAFGGDDLTDLYITTATSGLSAEARQREPLAGALFRCRPGARGLPPQRFAR